MKVSVRSLRIIRKGTDILHGWSLWEIEIVDEKWVRKQEIMIEVERSEESGVKCGKHNRVAGRASPIERNDGEKHKAERVGRVVLVSEAE